MCSSLSMPWRTSDAMDQRRQWIEAVQANPRESITALSKRFSISRKTGYKWIARLRDLDPSDPAAFENASSRPLRQPNSTSEVIVTAIVALRKEHPYWGPKKLRACLMPSFVGQPFPAASTVGDILKRHGLVVPRRSRIRWKKPKNFFIETTAPNDTWTVDFKGQFKLGDGTMCYPLTIMDLHSRYLLASTCFKSVHGEPAITEFKRIFRLYGLPRRIRSDNGTPFATSGPAGLSMLAALWVKLGIELERIDPGHPEQNGAHERMHLTLKTEAIRERKHTMQEQQIHMDRWRHQYNDLRPHESLAMQTPQSVYESSSITMPEIIPSIS